MRCRWGAAFLAAMLAGCGPATTGTRPDASAATGTRSDSSWYRSIVEPVETDPERFARFCGRALALKGNDLAAELERNRDAFEREKSELNRLQLALLLSLPGTGFRDDNVALALLAPFVKDKSREGSSLRPLALWLHAQVADNRRVEETLQQQTLKLRDEQKRAESLQQKLEALLDMEMKMIEREQNLPKKK